MKVIFLDVDGVLVHSNYENLDTCDIDTTKVELLKYICDETDAVTVISSSWRGINYNHTPKCYDVLRSVLASASIPVLGNTPFSESSQRAKEIKEWMLSQRGCIESFVIFDDEDWNWKDYGFERNWIQTSFDEGGLTKEHADHAICLLGKFTQGQNKTTPIVGVVGGDHSQFKATYMSLISRGYTLDIGS